MRLTDLELATWLAEARDIYARECSQIGTLLAVKTDTGGSDLVDQIAQHRAAAETLICNLVVESSLREAEWTMVEDAIRRYGEAVQDEHYWNERAKIAAAKPNPDQREIEEYVARSMRSPGTIRSESPKLSQMYRLNALIQVLEQTGR
ncbi:hypothetical protein [Natronoglycomyces albus]|uniref:Uncharacterized protein n=1 Tax=Natronoglycomyces albus TaxID=2811108 RepID=A0A895XSF2_9ACTN|nr:hypothetical protein [Natronoglycomyces albus]QSB06602.1 hypothetical protein JQS30_06810 [Natronoglycomyces albus]